MHNQQGPSPKMVAISRNYSTNVTTKPPVVEHNRPSGTYYRRSESHARNIPQSRKPLDTGRM